MLRSFTPLAAPGRRVTVFLASLVSLGLVCVLAASSVGRPIGTAAVCTVVLLAALGCLSGGSPRVVRTVVLLVLLGAGLTMQVYGSLMALFLLLPVGVLVSRGERRPAVVLAVAATATMSLLSTRLASSGTAVLVNVLPWGVLTGLSLVIGLLDNQALRRNQRVRAAFERARAEERRLIAAELHDSVTRLAAAVTIQAETTRLTHSDDPALAEAMTRIGDQCRTLTAELCSVLWVLRRCNDDRAELSEVLALDGVAGRVTPEERLRTETALLRHKGFQVLVGGAVPLGLGPVRRDLLSRVIAEALTNVRRHGDPAVPVRVMLSAEDDVVELVVVNGVPTAPRAIDSTGAGLESLRHGALFAGASLTSARSGDAWVLNLVMPLMTTAQPLEVRA